MIGLAQLLATQPVDGDGQTAGRHHPSPRIFDENMRLHISSEEIKVLDGEMNEEDNAEEEKEKHRGLVTNKVIIAAVGLVGIDCGDGDPEEEGNGPAVEGPVERGEYIMCPSQV